MPLQALTSMRHAFLATVMGAAVNAACWHGACAGTVDVDVRVYTDQAHPVLVQPGTTVTVIRLDEPQRLQAALSANLPPNEEDAAAIVRQRLAQGGAILRASMTQAYQGVAEAWTLGIKKVPAVVLDKRYVVYGEADLGKALAHIDQYRRAHP
jgi:integrating conjugative element protein (TIGR03757 family)